MCALCAFYVPTSVARSVARLMNLTMGTNSRLATAAAYPAKRASWRSALIAWSLWSLLFVAVAVLLMVGGKYTPDTRTPAHARPHARCCVRTLVRTFGAPGNQSDRMQIHARPLCLLLYDGRYSLNLIEQLSSFDFGADTEVCANHFSGVVCVSRVCRNSMPALLGPSPLLCCIDGLRLRTQHLFSS